MRDGGVIVSILVAHAALQVIEWSPPGSGDYLARFDKHRNRLEQIAGKKHMRGQIEGDGSIFVQRSDVQVLS
jgi:hypothetical protein